MLVNWYELLGVVLGSGGAIVAAITGFFSYLQKKSEQRTKSELNRIEKNTEGIARLEQKMESELVEVKKKVDSYADTVEACRSVNFAVLKNTLEDECKAIIVKSYITAEEAERIEFMADIYLNKMNGNGYIKHLIEQVRKLPIKEN